ncbi:hypothetical protein DFH28DRAFT_1130657 [Melampsora americana]|nr:hypothetical protein DFH28DRAFT_1130657 [Melampsora americana]
MTPSRIPPQVLLARRRRAICSRLAEQQTNHSLSINLDTAQVQSSGAKGKKQVGANKNKNGDKRKNPATPTPLPKVKKTVSHMDPGLTPTGKGGNRSQVVNQAESSVTSAPGESAKDSVAERSPNEEAKTSGMEGDKENDPDGRSDANPAAGGDQDKEESIKRSAMQSLSFKKKGKKEEGDENLSDTQKMRAVKIKAAREQYNEVRAIHDELSKSIKKLEERAKGGAIDKSVYILKRTCNKINQEMIEREEELLMALTSDHPDVIFVPAVFDPSAPSVARTPIDLDSSPPPNSAKGATVAKVTKRKQSSVEPEAEKKRKKMKASDYVLDEAKECNREASGEVLGKRAGRRQPYKSPRFVDPEDMEPEVEVEEGANVVYAEAAVKEKRKAAKEATVEEDDLESVPELYRKALKPDLSTKMLADGEHPCNTSTPSTHTLYFEDEVISILLHYFHPLIHTSHYLMLADGEHHQMREYLLTLPLHSTRAAEKPDRPRDKRDADLQGDTWNFDEDTLDDKIEASDLAPHINYMMELIDDNALMTKRLQTAPRLMQVSAKDPFLNEDSFDWSVLEDSARYPFKLRNGVFRSLQAMLCRTSKSAEWTDDPILATGRSPVARRGRTLRTLFGPEAYDHFSFCMQPAGPVRPAHFSPEARNAVPPNPCAM